MLPCYIVFVFVTGFGHMLAQHLDLLGVCVFAGCLFGDGEGADHLRHISSPNLHVLQMDITNNDQVNAAIDYIKKHSSSGQTSHVQLLS